MARCESWKGSRVSERSSQIDKGCCRCGNPATRQPLQNWCRVRAPSRAISDVSTILKRGRVSRVVVLQLQSLSGRPKSYNLQRPRVQSIGTFVKKDQHCADLQNLSTESFAVISFLFDLQLDRADTRRQGSHPPREVSE
jgi:hypothetical protein